MTQPAATDPTHTSDVAPSPTSRSRYEEITLLLLRGMVALLHFQHALQKMFGLLAPPAGTPGPPVGPAELFSRSWAAGVIETIFVPLVFVGLFTRPAAFLLAGEMAFAYFLVHAPREFYPVLNRGELPITFCFVYLYLSARGGGKYSLDRLLRKKR
jgi:putative oxidoreductase